MGTVSSRRRTTTARTNTALGFFLFMMGISIFGVDILISHLGSSSWLLKTKWFLTLAILITAILWVVIGVIKVKLWKGIRYAYYTQRMLMSARKELLEAGIYTVTFSGYARLPSITVDIDKELLHGTVRIADSIKHHTALSNMQLSPSLNKYIVDYTYQTDDENWFVFEIVDSSFDRRLRFTTFDDFREQSDTLSPYCFFIDNQTQLALCSSLIVGQTGSGKTYSLYSLVLQFLCKAVEYHMYFADPKASSLAVLGHAIAPDLTASDIDGIIGLLSSFCESMHNRESELYELLSQKLDSTYADFGLSPHIFIFDEFAAFQAALAKKDKKVRDNVNDLLSQIILKGRQLGFFLIICMQKSDSTLLPTLYRDNLPLKVVIGNAEPTTYITTYGSTENIPGRNYRVGEGVYTHPSLAPLPRYCVFPELSFDILEAAELTQK